MVTVGDVVISGGGCAAYIGSAVGEKATKPPGASAQQSGGGDERNSEMWGGRAIYTGRLQEANV